MKYLEKPFELITMLWSLTNQINGLHEHNNNESDESLIAFVHLSAGLSAGGLWVKMNEWMNGMK